jgi:ATP-dependent Lon protease
MDLPDRTGVMILGNCHLFPGSVLPLRIFEPRYRRMLSDALEGNRMFCLAMNQPVTSRERPCEVAGLGMVRVSLENPDGTSNLVLQGISRVRLGKATRYRPYRVHEIEPLASGEVDTVVADALVERTLDLVDARLRLVPTLPASFLAPLLGTNAKAGVKVVDCIAALRKVGDPGALADVVASLVLPDPVMRQIILQTIGVEDRLRHLVRFLTAEVAEASSGGTA